MQMPQSPQWDPCLEASFSWCGCTARGTCGDSGNGASTGRTAGGGSLLGSSIGSLRRVPGVWPGGRGQERGQGYSQGFPAR